MSVKKYDVYGIGNAIMDLQVEVSDAELSSFGVEKGSMRLIDFETLNNLQHALKGKDIKRSSGGSGANTIIALSQLGKTAAYGCIVADDPVGNQYFSELQTIGVSLFNKPVTSESLTGHSVVMITPDAERSMSTYLGITSTFGPEHVSEDAIEESHWLYVEGYLFSSDTGREAVNQAISAAKNSGTKVAITLSDGFIVDCFRDPLISAIGKADLIFANKNEAMSLTKTPDEVEAIRLLREYCPNIVVTLGEKGAIASYDGVDDQVDAFPVIAVDDTGAGDAFAAGFLDGCLRGLPLRSRLLIGCFLASRVVSQYGARIKGDLRMMVETEVGLIS
ncbi:MAG TPA: adenosine kinase [Oligoflexia bacterium]|nr:adenosine kinase [Oligoflexia bacterium]HMP47436.1 adenosine kinase [Oligoflexia bacterium]